MKPSWNTLICSTSYFTFDNLTIDFSASQTCFHDDVIKWKYFPRYWPFVRGIHRSPVNSPHKGQWRGALIFSSICARINGRVNNVHAGDLRRYRAHYYVIVMYGALDLYALNYFEEAYTIYLPCLKFFLHENKDPVNPVRLITFPGDTGSRGIKTCATDLVLLECFRPQDRPG